MTRITFHARTLKEVHSKRTAMAVKAKKEKELEEAKAAKEIEKRTKEEVLRLHMQLNGSKRTRKSREFLSEHFDLTTADSKWKIKPKEVCQSPKGAAICIDGKLCVGAPMEITITAKPEVREDTLYEFDELVLGEVFHTEDRGSNLELLAHIAAEEE